MIIFSANQNGMVDRISTIMFAQRIAELTGRTHLVKWDRNSNCNCAMKDLFSCRIPEIHHLPRWYGVTKKSDPVDAAKEIGMKTEDVVIDGCYNVDFTNFESYFKPVVEIAVEVMNFVTNTFSPSMIGVHIRRTDKLPPPWCAQSPEIYMQAAEREARETGEDIFLATDDAKVKELYAGRACCHTTNFNRNTEDGIRQALISLCLLKRCRLLVGSDYSSYFRLAATGKPRIFIPWGKNGKGWEE